MALSIEFAIREEFVNSLLLAFLEHVLKEDERQLSHEELVVVTIMALHLGALPRNLRHTVVVSAIKLL